MKSWINIVLVAAVIVKIIHIIFFLLIAMLIRLFIFLEETESDTHVGRISGCSYGDMILPGLFIYMEILKILIILVFSTHKLESK